jgi:hypothetical protein
METYDLSRNCNRVTFEHSSRLSLTLQLSGQRILREHLYNILETRNLSLDRVRATEITVDKPDEQIIGLKLDLLIACETSSIRQSDGTRCNLYCNVMMICCI